MNEYNMSHTGQELDDAINKVQSGYILPVETLYIRENGIKNVKQYEHVDVNVPVPSGYIEIAGTKLYVTQFASGDYTPTSDTYMNKISISGMPFKPKIFLISNYSGITSATTSTHALTSSFFVTDNNYDVLQKRSCYLYYNSSQKTYMGSQSGSAVNTFAPSANGVTGGSGTTVYTKGGCTYNWWAWG